MILLALSRCKPASHGQQNTSGYFEEKHANLEKKLEKQTRCKKNTENAAGRNRKQLKRGAAAATAVRRI